MHMNSLGEGGDSQITNLIHTALAGIIKLCRLTLPAQHDRVALVQPQPDNTIDVFLGLLDAGFEEFSLGREVEAVVEDFGVVDGDESVAEGADLAVED